MVHYGLLKEPYIYPDTLEVKGKPPKLKFDILEFLALKGNCSKTDLRNGLDRYYPDISHSVDELSRGEYIRFAHKKLGRGKMQVYYAISEKGLKALLYYDKFVRIRFWEILHGYCQHNDKIVAADKIDEFYQIVIRRYLKYYDHGFSSQLDIFDDLCNNWFQETIVKSNGITPLQKVIEILASYPKITFEKLVQKTGQPKERVKKILLSHSHNSKLYEESLTWKKINQTYTDFLIQNIITEESANDAEPTYELSLFGVMLCLVMIRYNDMDRLKGGLYLKEFSFEEYYDLVALNYKKKLPLTFGKWNQLKGILKVFTYYNFDIILNREIRYNNKNTRSVRKGGNRELIEGIREIILDNRELMSNFASAGRKVLGNYMIMDLFSRMHPEAPSPSLDRVYWLCGKLNELQILLDPSPPPTEGMSFLMGYMTQGTRSILKRIEESFADEITAFYYMNLYNDSNIRVSEPRKYYDSKSFKTLDMTPKEGLSLLVEQDKEKPSIKEWLCKWRDDLTLLQSQIWDDIKTIV